MWKPNLILSCVVIILFSCRTKNKFTYSIVDFRYSLQPFLTATVAEGIVTYHGKGKLQDFSDKELINLSKSESPILRATAFTEMFRRNTFNDFKLLMNHLDDTAIVATDEGEFGIWFQTVSDYILQEAEWDTQQEKSKTIEEVITKHNYLRSAYTILNRIDPDEQFYSFIKDMASRPRRLSRDGYELGFDEIEFALAGLARFKKREDVEIIKKKMMEHIWELSDRSLHIIEKYPDTTYMEVLESYSKRQFYHFSGYRPGGFTGAPSDRAAPEDFIDALVAQQSERCVKLLESMLKRLSEMNCFPDRNNILEYLKRKIWENPCPAYKPLLEKLGRNKQFKQKIEQWENNYISIDTTQMFTDTTKSVIRWL